ncbi:MAG: T9SS type A sorting domain-containing protein [Candidatus Kapaibacteriota bacterium]
MIFYKIKFVFFIFAVSLLGTVAVRSQGPVLIFNEYTASDTVDMGMCVVGDSLETLFNITNYSGRVLKIGGNDYTFLIGRAIDDPNNLDFFEFFGPRDLPRTIDTNASSLFSIKYIPFSPSIQFPPGKKIVKLWLGLFDPKVNDPPGSLNEIVKGREFILIARKSVEELDVFETVIDFDSVWVNPKDTIYRILTVQNNTRSKLTVDSIIFLRSLNAEIRLERKPTPITFDEYRSGDERNSWRLSYYPINLGRDTAVLRFQYHSPSNPDSVKYVQTIIRGVGVTQKVKLQKVENAQIVENFIDLGDVPIDTTKIVKIYIQNTGNLPFGILKQEILNYFTNTPSNGFKFLDTLSTEKSLLPTQIDSFTVLFTPTQRDTFLAKIRFTSNITQRQIVGYPESAKEIVFNIRGVGLAPKLTAEADSIDFGNIIVNQSEGCPTIRDTNIRITNSGNFVLRVQNARIEPPYPQTPFKILEENFEIPAYSNKLLKILFDSTARNIGPYDATLILTSSFSRLRDTLRIKLKANGVLPDPIKLTIPETIRFKPGSVLSIPILVQKEKITRAKEYQDTLQYNPDILRFRNATILGTSAERITQLNVKEQQPGLLSIFIATKWNEFLLPSDTLILLNFDTFLGESMETQFDFLSPRFGDGVCSRALSPIVQSGFIRVDSLCGLPYKLFDGNRGFFRLETPKPNPVEAQLNFEFEVAFETHTKLLLYDSYGNIIDTFFDEVLKPGVYRVDKDVSKLPTGVYFIQITSGIFNEVQHFVRTE